MEKYSEENFKNVISKSINYSDVCRNLNLGTTKGNRDTIKKYVKKFNIDVSHFYTPHSKEFNKKRMLNDILVENSTYNHTTNLKKRLYKEGLKQRCCELCGQGEEWQGKKMSLILDHINGVSDDNRIENLRIVCPNCNATLDTHGGKNISSLKPKEKIKKNVTRVNIRKVERPNVEVLIDDIKILGYSKTGLKYGVSDNAIRKWIKTYGFNPKELKKLNLESVITAVL